MRAIIKPDVKITNKGSLYYQVNEQGHLIRFQPRRGNAFTFLYDFFMIYSVFPKKFNADLKRHSAILSEAFKNIHGQKILELGTGSGSAAEFLPPDNTYIGSDVSTGLLKIAVKRFRQAGFQDPEFYVASGDDLPFAGESFDLCLCILSLNFIGNHKGVFEGVHAMLHNEGVFLGCVPVPERNQGESMIHGRLLSEARLQNLCHRTGFDYERIQADNGALLYFWAVKSDK